MQFKDMMKRQDDVGRGGQADERPMPGKSVVIAEKERAARGAIALQVMDLGYVPLITDNGDRALGMASEYQPRALIANLELEGRGGQELLAALRENQATRDIPVVLISNTDKTPDMVVGSQVGADDYICKPIDGPEVKARLRELLLKASRDIPQPAPAAAPSEESGGEAAEAASVGAHIERAEQIYAASREFAKHAMECAGREEPPDIEQCRELAIQLVQECRQSNRLLLKAIRPYEPAERTHDAPNVAIFSIKIGHGLNYDIEELTALAMAEPLCHEVGMACVPEDVAQTEGKYSKRQWNHLRQHPEHAYRLLGKLGEQYQWLAEAVYQAHERERGQGYPRGLKGDEICEFAKIIGLADTYESLSHPRSFRKAFIAFDALREVIGIRNKDFPPHIIRALVSEVSVFPLESYVLLNTGETARVVKTNPDNLLRPAVVLEYDASGQKLRRPNMVDLASQPLIYVTKPVDERDLTK